MISIQGPKALEIAERLFPPSVMSLKYYRGVVTDQMSKPCIVSRTGYTGEDGFELIVRSEDAARVWENLMLAGREHGIMAVGLGARDTLRLEAGMPLYGHELSEAINPFTAGLGFAVSLKDRTFLGSEALLALNDAELPLKRVGLKLDGRRAARENTPILTLTGEPTGEVTSGTFSPNVAGPDCDGLCKERRRRAGYTTPS
jgi:aminomethyltransferase